MKRLVIVVACVAAIAAAALLSATGRVPLLPAVAAAPAAFDGLPIDQPQVVEFGRPQLESDEPTLYARRTASALDIDLDGAMRRETADQVRDWLLMTILSASPLSAAELNQALYDLPPIRRGQFDRIAKFDYGETRARAVRNGDVIALIPAGTKAQRTDALAHILDEQRKNTGAIAGSVEVFEYDLAADLQSATVTRRTPIKGGTLFSAEAGYAEWSVASLGDLQAFVAATDDLTYARRDGGTLIVGGRRHQAQRSRNIRVEDIAAIWQSEGSAEGRRRGSGFSLDPQFEFGKLRRIFESKIAPWLSSGGASDLQIQEMQGALSRSDIGGFLTTFRAACSRLRSPQVCEEMGREIVLSHQFQAARYDGSLQGTEVGMVLFYTDLLMKLWSFDYERSTPRAVAGFPNETAMEVAAIYRTELIDLPGTRLWLGSLEDGYQIGTAGHELLFARVATRVFAVPNDAISGKDRTESTEPHIYNRTFMTWWNDHYQEVARYEPEYERLNEIMKWSQLIAWLNTLQQGSLLGFLEGAKVNRANRFTEWVQRRPELTYRNWAAITFKPTGYEGTTTEALAMLHSRAFRSFEHVGRFSGGVSLARRTEFVNRASLADDVPVLARRARLDYAKSNTAAGELHTAQKIEYKLHSASSAHASTIARVPTSQRLRGLVSEFRHSDLERTITRTRDGMLIRARAMNAEIGGFHVSRTAQGFRAGWRAREIDRGQAIARRASRSTDMARSLARDPDVEAVIKLAGDNYLVKPIDSDRWMKVTVGADDSKVVHAGYDARVSGNGSGARNLDIAWPDDAALTAQMRDVGWIHIDSTETRGGALWVADARGPPAGAGSRTVQFAGQHISFVGEPAGGRVMVRASDLPAQLRTDPGRLRALLKGADSGPIGDTSVVSVLERGDYQRTATVLAEDPARFRAGFEARLAQEQQRTARLIAEGQYAEARVRSDALMAVWGEQPEFRLQRALAQLGEHDAKGAARTLDGGFKRPVNQRYFDEIDRRLADSQVSASERENLTSLRRVVEWRNDRARRASDTAGDLVAVADGDALRIEYHADTLTARPAHLSTISNERAMLYVEDTPGLNNVDWSPATLNGTINGLVSGGRVQIHLLDVSLSHYSPARIVELHSRTTLRRVTPAARGLDALPNDGCSDSNGDDRQGCRIYIVRTPPARPLAQR